MVRTLCYLWSQQAAVYSDEDLKHHYMFPAQEKTKLAVGGEHSGAFSSLRNQIIFSGVGKQKQRFHEW